MDYITKIDKLNDPTIKLQHIVFSAIVILTYIWDIDVQIWYNNRQTKVAYFLGGTRVVKNACTKWLINLE